MSFFSFLYKLILGPLVMLFDVTYTTLYYITMDIGISIIFLSLTVNLLILPLYRRADALQEEERVRTEKLSRGVKHIKKVFKGDERFMMLQTYYRQNSYKPYYALSGSLSLLLEIPFFIAAYHFLSNLDLLNNAAFGSIRDLGQPDAMLHIAGHAVNLLPILMTAINIVSGIIYTKGMPIKSKAQLYGMALIFLVFLYSSPSGLVFYWTLNNLFSLVKNVFYKIKNPKLVLCVICASIGCIGLPYILFVKPMRTTGLQLFSVAGLLLMTVPLIVYYAVKKYGISFKLSDNAVSKKVNVTFLICCVCMTVFTGILIPSAVIKASPAEFVSVSDFHNPLRYVVTSFALAAGTFMIWLNIFYRLSSNAAKRVICLAGVIVSLSAAIDYMFFGKNYGNMSSLMEYDNLPIVAKSDVLINAAVLLALAIIVCFVWKIRFSITQSVAFALCGAVVIMSCVNIFSVQVEVSDLRTTLQRKDYTRGIKLTLDKNGKNVVVFMVDRAISDYFPYIIEEKPELKEQFAGFTFYPNTISYGNCTLLGSPGLFGGYEYTPEEMNRRDSLTLIEKHNEALKLMPALFSENGYKVTVCDPPLANYYWIPDLTIYDEYPDINTYVTKAKLLDVNSLTRTEELRNHNFFAYSIFRSAPVLLHNALYRGGSYNHSGKSFRLVSSNMYVAEGNIDGVDSIFMGSYGVLQSLHELTDISDGDKGAFLIIDNDTAHDVTMLQEPEYEPAHSVDNTAYEKEHGIRRTADGDELQFENKTQLVHYQCNMAAMIQLGKWMDYLRENGLYDNTRIIIVSDHGYDLNNLFNKTDDSADGQSTASPFDISSYKALLMVKDFDSSEFKTDGTFMTNADTPSIAFKGLIKNPVNPFTGKKISSKIKDNNEHHIASTTVISPNNYKREEKQFKSLKWITLTGNDTFDGGAWQEAETASSAANANRKE